MPFFTRVFRGKDSNNLKKNAKSSPVVDLGATKPKWTDAWLRTEVGPEEVQDLIRGCTVEIKARALDTPFLLLPFRPTSDPSASRTFIRNYFNHAFEKGAPQSGEALMQELRLTEPMVLCSVLKWCWSRLPGGVVTWEAYELFKVGEQDSQLARDAFSTFIPISVDSDARTKIIFDFFELLAAIAAHGKSNGLGGRKLSRYAGWWAFEHADTGNGFEAAYKNWSAAADATSHLFFAYLRSISPDSPRGISGIASLPIALQSLVQATEYPPETPVLLQVPTTKVVMIVDTVSPTPFALLRRAKNFEYRDSDWHLQEFAAYEDPVRALTDECLRVLRCISSTNQSSVSSSKTSTSLRDASWSRFEDIGFGGAIDSDHEEDSDALTVTRSEFGGLRSAPHSIGGDLGRPTTPSWADFLSSGFTDENGLRHATPLLLPPDKVLPPIATVRGQSSQSHKRSLDTESPMEPGELASITTFDLDDSFWWVWISSLAGEEPAARKAVFGRCALLETIIRGTKWLVLEEQVKGAAPEPDPEAYIVEKKRFFSFTRRNKVSRRKSTVKGAPTMGDAYQRSNNQAGQSKTSIAPDQHARIQAAAAALQKKHREEQDMARGRRARALHDDDRTTSTNSVLTLQPSIMNEASQALKWASNYDKHAYRSAYLSNSRAGTGAPTDAFPADTPPSDSPEATTMTTTGPTATPTTTTKQPPSPPKKDVTPVSPPQSPPAATPAVTPEAPAPAPVPTPAPVEDGKPAKPVLPVKETAVVAATALVAPETVAEQPVGATANGDRKVLKKRPVNTGFKSMFGTNKKKADEKPALKPTGAEPSAVAAARAALEGKAKAAQSTSPTSLPSAQASSPPAGAAGGGARIPGLKKKPAPASPTTTTATPAATAASPPPPASPPPAVESPVTQPAAPVEEKRTSPLPFMGPPQTRHAIEQDALSRVATAERDAADQEFSTFDQGPLAEQPAFAPEKRPSAEAARQPPASKTQAMTEPVATATSFVPEPTTTTRAPAAAAAPAPAPAPAPTAAAAVADRWAQIRRNAAERSGVSMDETERRSSQADRTDDGDTSGEETIESRVARIKARVAQLTSNMEAAR